MHLIGKHFLIALNILWITSNVNAQNNYYISNSGNDGATGLSPGKAWQTIQKLKSVNLNPGDSVFFERGNVWRTPLDATLSLSDDGTLSKYIYYGAYGTGERPRILGSITSNKWTNEGNNIWSTNDNIPQNPYSLTYTCQIFFELNNDSIAWGEYKNNINDISIKYEWGYENGKVYVYSTSDPSTAFKSIEMPQEQNLCNTGGRDYIHIDQIEFAYAANAAIRDPYSSDNWYGFKVSGCWIHHIGNQDSGQAFGLSLKHSLMHIYGNEFSDLGRRAISIHLYGDFTNATCDSVIIEKNLFGTGHHTLGIDIGNDGGTNNTISNFWIRNNVFYGNPASDHSYDGLGAINANTAYIVCDNTGNCNNENFYFYNNLILYPEGVITFTGIYNLFIDHNSFYGANTNPAPDGAVNLLHFTRAGTHRTGQNVNVRNNIGYNSMHWSDKRFVRAVYIKESEIEAFNEFDYNLWWCEDERQQMINTIQDGKDYNYFRNNNGGKMSLSEWTRDWGFDAHSPKPANPKYSAPKTKNLIWTINQDVTILLPNLYLSKESPAISAGKPVPWIKTDFFGYERDPDNPDIGAFEYGYDPPVSIPTTEIKKKISVYPCPANDYIVISSDQIKYHSITIYNINGQNVYSKNVGPGNINAIDVAKLKPGIYLLVINGNNVFYTEKIIKK